MIYTIISISFSFMAMVFSLDMFIRNKLGRFKKVDSEKSNIHYFIHFLNSTAILIIAWQCLKGFP